MTWSKDADAYGLQLTSDQWKQLNAEIKAIKQERDIYREALVKIAVPNSIETDGTGSAEEYEELYDFWHMKAAESLNIAQDALRAGEDSAP